MIRYSLLSLLLISFSVLKGQTTDATKISLKNNQNINNNKDTLPKTISLGDVVVRGKKPPLSFKIDRQVYSAATFANAANGTAVDLIKNLPSVSVNGQGELSVRGSSSVQILINGRPTQGDALLVLGQISAASIESVEFINSPGAAYDADGKSGILNIITKNAPEGGLLLQSTVMLGAPAINNFKNISNPDPKRHSIDFSMGYKKRSWDISLGFNFLRNDIAGFREGDVFTIGSTYKTSFPSSGERSFQRYNYGGRVLASYQFDTKNSIDFAVYQGKKYQSRVADLDYTNTKTDLTSLQPLSSFTYFNANTAEKQGFFTLASLGSSHQLNKSLLITQSFQFEGARLESLTTNFNYSDRINLLLYQETLNRGRNPLNAFRWKTDLKKSNGLSTLQAGLQIRYDNQNGDFTYLYRNAINRDFITDPLFTGSILVTNNIQSAYIQYSSQFEKLFLQGGLRVEHMYRKVKVGVEKFSPLSLLSIFPSYLFRYSLSSKSIVKHSFTRRVKRTNNFELNPLPEREHSETLEQGDPNLLPELTGIWELGLEQKLKKGVLQLGVYHQRSKNPIQRVNNVYNDTILGRLFTNVALATQTGLDIGFNYRIRQHWQFIVGGNAYYYSVKGQLFSGVTNVNNSSWVYSVNAAQVFSLKPDLTINFNINYLSIRATAQGEDGAFLNPALSIKKAIKDNRWNFQLQWLNMDAGLGITNTQRITTRGQLFYTTTNYIYERDQIQFSVGFNISKKNRKINLPESEMVEKEF